MVSAPRAHPGVAPACFALVPAAATAGAVLARYGELALVEVERVPVTAWASWTDLDPIRVHGVPRTLPSGCFEPGAGPRCILRFAGPVLPAWRETLATLGWTPRFDCPPSGLCADVGGDLVALRAALPALRAIAPYAAEDCARAGAGGVAALPDTVDAVAFSVEDRVRLEGELTAAGLQVVASSPYKLRVSGDAGAVGRLRDAVGVKIADPGTLPRTASLSLRLAIGATALPESAGGATGAQGGEGELIAFADTGLGTGATDAPHPDFAGRVQAIHSWPLAPGWSAFVRAPGADDGGADRG
ncbi:MAG TPA: peptidase S8/S53 subtilisin kexin sedolisin, partial [Thauera aminoaromatica]|nr:peptidase S8/S53 subtilisin kexin sedolisin [Thauera aminoaromatica]